MTTEYDLIAADYLKAKVNPIKKYSEEFTFFQVLGDVRGQAILDLACGDGYYTRQIRQAGADPVIGVDVSHQMIQLGQKAETEDPLGIDYRVADVAELGQIGVFAGVTAVYLLQYAGDAAALEQMMRTAYANLEPGGRFVTVSGIPDLTPEHIRVQAQYGAIINLLGPATDGTRIETTLKTPNGEVRFHNHYWSQQTLEHLLHKVGFHTLTWHPMAVAPEGYTLYPPPFWSAYLEHPGIVVLECWR
jgi:ubiquinone/menaquinone biosynthesis C-methylase UbiE